MIKHLFFQTIVFLLFSFLLADAALAHRVTVFAWVEGNTVYGEGKFSGGRKAQGAEVIVYDSGGKQLLRTHSDENGGFSFPIPQKTGLKIELLAGMGHKGEWTLTAEEVGADAADTGTAAQPAAVPSESPKAASADSSAAPESENHQTRSATADMPDKAQLQEMIQKSVEKSLDEKLKPLIRMLADAQQKGPGFNEIAGGIGYIFGLMGVILYFKSRKQKG